MKLIIDANILFSILIKKGKTDELLFNNKLQLFAPEFLFDEFYKYEKLILEKTHRTNEEFRKLFHVLKHRIIIIQNEETKHFLDKAKDISPDKFDVEYFALAINLNCAIWSNDKELKEKQNVIKIYSTTDLLQLFH